MKGLLVTSLMLFFVAGTAQQHGKTTAIQTKKNVGEDFRAQAVAILKVWDTDYNDEKDAARTASLYRSDALLSSSGGSTEGRANIQQVLQRGIESGEKITNLSITRAKSSRGIAFAAGTYTAIEGGKAHPGHFVTVFEKVAGKWLISVQLAVPLPTKAMATEEKGGK